MLLISLWNYLRGYVMIEVSGFSIERFLNLAMHRGIYIWDINRFGNKAIMKVGVSGYKLLKPCAKKTGCQIKIKDKKGFPFITYRYRKRKMIPIGILLFVILIYIMSSFIWLVEVKGNERVSAQDIIEKLSQNGYKVGALKYKMDLRYAEQVIMKNFPDILWTGISFEGTKLIIELTETVEKPQELDYTKPCNIVAKADAHIVQIVTRKGTPKVKPGDTVRKGDVLVSSEVVIGEEGDKNYVHASADIIAKTYYSVQAKIKMQKINKKYTGIFNKGYEFIFFGNTFKIYNPKIVFDKYDNIVKSKQFKITSKFPLPFYWVEKKYIEYKPETIIISDEDAQDKLTIALYNLLKQNMHEDGEVINQDIVFEKKENFMIGKLQAVVKEELGSEAPLQIDDGRN